MFEKFTDKAKKSIVNAKIECEKYKGNEITTNHLLLGILRFDNEQPVIILKECGVPINELIYDLENSLPRDKGTEFHDIPLTSNAASVMKLMDEWCKTGKFEHIDLAHVLLGMLAIENCAAARMLRKYGVSHENVAQLMQ